jgi:predicted kinase
MREPSLFESNRSNLIINRPNQTHSISSLCAQNALEDMCNYLADEGEVAIFDATNTTRDRRQLIYDYCTQTFCFRVFFVESICDSLEIIEANIRVRERER